MPRPIGIDLFSGAGGLSLGFEQAGFDVVAAVEVDPIHAAVHERNFPKCKVIARSITDLSGDEIRRLARIGPKEVDVVFGGAPCQGFSMIGQRALDDHRNLLVKEFVRIVRELKAKYFVFENVKGLTQGSHRKFLRELIEEFQSSGYSVRNEWRVLNACHYGVPQDRQRLFLLGAREGQLLPEYPSPITTKPGSSTAALPFAPTCHDALKDLPDADRFKTLLFSDTVRAVNRTKPSAYGLRMRCDVPDGWGFGYKRTWDKALLTSSMRTEHTEISRRRFSETNPGSVEPVSRFFRLPVDGVSNTLRAGTDAARGAFTSPRPIHYKYDRCITVREMARLHGFPDWFRFNETKWHGARQIGNAVPPPLAKAVAGEVIKALGILPSRPSVKVACGDDRLLQMGMAEAAAHFGIEAPIARRNMKSGAKKRRQADIEAERLRLSKAESANADDFNLIDVCMM
jgi:DNA (cytosine-5)-methyltransferase 1